MLQDRDRPGTVQIIRGFLIQGISIFAIAYLLMLLFWPRALIDPIFYPFHVLSVFSNFTYYVTTFFEGQEIQWIEIPWYYVPRWLSMVMPEFVFLGLILGAGWLVVFRSRVTFSLPSLKWALVLFSALFPPSYAVLIGSPLGDGLRHFLFIYPPLAILSASGVQAIVQNTPSVWFRKSLIALVGLLLVLTLWDMIRLHPNQYIYFNRLFAGGLQKAAKQYQTDYWENTYKQAVRWIDKQYPQPQNRKLKIGAASNNIQYLLGDSYTFIEIPEPKEMDLYLSVTRADWHRLVPGEIIHTINVDEVPLLYIIKPDSTYQSDPFFMSARERQIRLARRYDQVGNLNKSAQTYEILLKENGDPTVFSNLAESYIQLNRYEEAIEMCREALALQPNHVKSILRLANAFTYLNRFEEAEKMFQRTLQLQPDQKEGLHNYASLLLAHKKPSQAVIILNKALKAYPTHPSFWTSLARAYRQTKNLESAWTSIARASDLDPSNAKIQAEYINIGTTYLAQDQLEEAHNIYQAILKINPGLPILYFNLGIIYNRQERLEDAARMYQRTTELSANDSQAYLELAKIFQKLGRQEETDQAYQKYLSIKQQTQP